jgi:cellulose 1,4-beta-cellobiosidase
LGDHSAQLHRTPWIITLTLAVALAGGCSAHRSLPARTAPHTVTPATARARSLTRLCGQAGWPEAAVDGGAYIVQNDEWNSTAPECITTDGGAQFTVASSSISEPVSGDPGGYSSIFSGCSAGVCTAGNKLPIRVSDLRPGMVTSSWVTTQPSSGAYDVAYDIWFNRTRVTSGAPDGGELMIWLAHRGGSQIAPAGTPVTNVTIGGYGYTVWLWSRDPGRGPAQNRIAYVMNRGTSSVGDLDLSAVTTDAARRGYLAGSSYLLNVQAGFEIWQGGSGLETRSFALSVGR